MGHHFFDQNFHFYSISLSLDHTVKSYVQHEDNLNDDDGGYGHGHGHEHTPPLQLTSCTESHCSRVCRKQGYQGGTCNICNCKTCTNLERVSCQCS